MGGFLPPPPPGPDPIPNLFTFAPQTSVAQGATITSNELQPIGFDTAATVTFSAGVTGSRDHGVHYSSSLSSFNPGEVLKLQLTSSASYSVLTHALVFYNGTQVGSFDVTTLSDPALSYVAPGAGWSGAAKSGGVPAVFPGGNVTADPITRTTAKPAIHWVVPSGRCLAPGQDMIIGVDADAGGAGASVTGTISGTTLTLTPYFGVTSTPTIVSGGSGGAAHANSPGNASGVALTGTTGTGLPFVIGVTIAGGIVTAITSVYYPGYYTALPGTLSVVAVTGGDGLTGCTVNLTGHTGSVTHGTIAAGMTLSGVGASPSAYGTILSGSGSTWTLDTSSTVGSPTDMRCQGPVSVKQVDFWVEGAVQTVSTPKFLTWVENGISKTAWGYFIKLRQSDFSAGGYSGTEARIFATAIPNDPTMQNRVIGYDLVNAGSYDGNYPMSVFPRASANDKSYTVNAANNDVSPNFTTIKKALTQAASDSAEFPLVTFTATANYELENLANHAVGHGFCTLAHSGGVVATLQRAADYTPDNPSTWPWTPGWEALEFRGSGIVFQQRNWTQILNSRPCWFNNCKFTNSIAARDTNYWNNTSQGYVGGSGPSWVDNAYSEFVSGMYLGAYYVIGAQAKATGGSVFSGVHLTQNTFVNDFSNDYFQSPGDRISITYTATGGHTTATVSRAGGSNNTAAGQVMLLKVDGSTVATIHLGLYSNDTNPTVTDVVAAINAVSGWSASVLNPGGPGGIWPAVTIGGGGGDWSFTGNAFGVAYTARASADPHGEWWQGYTGSFTRENVILRNDVVLNNGSMPFINNDANVQYDTIIKGQVWLGTGNSPFYVGGQFNNHYVIQNVTTNVEWARREYVNGDPNGSPDPGDQVYTSISNNIIGIIAVFGYNGVGTYSPYSPAMTKNFYAFGNSTMNGPSDTANVNYTGSTFASLFVNSAIVDLRPVGAGLLLANQFAPPNPFGGRGLAFANPDIVGAWPKGAPQYIEPF